jgi:hypothetical protein
VTLKEHDYLFAIRPRPMMFLLIADIHARFLDSGHADAERRSSRAAQTARDPAVDVAATAKQVRVIRSKRRIVRESG